MAMTTQHIQLAKTLPPILKRFFARFPPPALLDASSDAAEPPTSYSNPFRPTKHPVTERWHNPVYSLRRQAVLYKLATAHGVQGLLPPTPKSAEERLKKRVEEGLRVRGTGVGQKVKGHWDERTLKRRLETRRQAMINMPQLVQKWKTVRRTGRERERGTDGLSRLALAAGGRSTPNRHAILETITTTSILGAWGSGWASSVSVLVRR